MIELIVRRHRPLTQLHALSLPDNFMTHGSVDKLRHLAGITAEHAWELFNQTSELDCGSNPQ